MTCVHIQLLVVLCLVCKALAFSNPMHKGWLRSTLRMTDSDNNAINPPKCYVVLSNIQSGSNVGSICRNALAFNVDEVIVVGRRNFRDKMRQADRGAKVRQKFVHFNSVAEAQTYLKVPLLRSMTVNSLHINTSSPHTFSARIMNKSRQNTLDLTFSAHPLNPPPSQHIPSDRETSDDRGH